jgi:hypothetical protein
MMITAIRNMYDDGYNKSEATEEHAWLMPLHHTNDPYTANVPQIEITNGATG